MFKKFFSKDINIPTLRLSGVIGQAGIARSNFSKEDLITNIKFFVDSINKERPSGVKGEFIKKVTISPTMGPGINIDLNSVIN